jgi:cbb3-type cytochrome oxidase maturation protein
VAVIYLVLPLALLLSALALGACIRAIRAGQFDDLDTPGVRPLLDE